MATTNTPPRKIHLLEITAESSPSALAHARELMLEYGSFVLQQPDAALFCFGTLEIEVANMPASYLEKGGGSLVAYADQQPVGFVAWRTAPASVAPAAWEMKRLWVRPSGRGLGLGKKLSLAVLERARAAGRSAVYLDTAPASMASAVRLYRELGFEPCSAYGGDPVEGLAYFRKLL
jgi:ribosomal protein S18 acetylase RimI-like enzyme